MATSGTTSFLPDVAEILEEAYERVIDGGTSVGYDIRTGRRSLNLLTLEWANRGIHLWTIDSGSIPLVQSTATYNLPNDTIDLLDVAIRTTISGQQSDAGIGRMSLAEYTAIPSKTMESRPNQFMVNRLVTTPTVTVWPVPNASSTYSLVYWRMRRIQDTGSDGAYTMDVPARMLPALIAGLAYYIAMKKNAAKVDSLKAIYEEQFLLATGEDRDRAAFRVVPKVG